VFSLKNSEETWKVYPFNFELKISYVLENNTLIVKYDIINHSSEEMYYSIGAHPAFAIEGNFEEYSLIFDEEKDLETHQLNQDLFSGKTEIIKLERKCFAFEYHLFEQDALVLKILLRNL
jgi:galactose mutarotase-like enzyme